MRSPLLQCQPFSSFALAWIGCFVALDLPESLHAIPATWASNYIRRETGVRPSEEDVQADYPHLESSFDTPGLSNLVRLETTFESDEDSRLATRKSLTLAGTCCNRTVAERRHLPPLGQFRQLWEGKMDLDRAEPTFGKRFDSKMKLVLGVFSQMDEVDARLVMRQTWLQQRGVCIAGHGLKEECTVYAAFVVGVKAHKKMMNSSVDWESPDLMHVNHDKPSLFKLRDFLKEAPKRYPWATHYGKMDTDTFVHVNQMVPRVPMPNKSCEVFFGTSILSHGCGLREITAASKNDQEKFRVCMHGALYVVSRDLLIGMTHPGGEVEDWLSGMHREIGEEDIAFGMAVTSYIRRTNRCLVVAEAGAKDDPAGAFDHCGVNCGNVFSHGKFR